MLKQVHGCAGRSSDSNKAKQTSGGNQNHQEQETKCNTQLKGLQIWTPSPYYVSALRALTFRLCEGHYAELVVHTIKLTSRN